MSTQTMPSTGKPNGPSSGFYPRKSGQFKTRYFENVELKVAANTQELGQQTNFVDQDQLRNQADQLIIIKAIETWSNQVVPFSPTGAPVATPAQIKSAYLVLNVKSFNWENLIPLACLNRIYGDQTTGANFVPFTQHLFLWDDISGIIWPKSFVQFASGSGDNAAFSFLFGVHYEIIPDTMSK